MKKVMSFIIQQAISPSLAKIGTPEQTR